jgi:hypothetical protein
MMYSKARQIGKRKKPKQKDRTKITKKEYNKTIEIFGNTCFCGNPYIELHHIRFRSHGGVGRWRNLIPLCKAHHTLAHTDNQYRRHLEIQRMRMFGEFYWCDAHDLYEKGIIPEPTEKEMEAYFEKVVREKSL